MKIVIAEDEARVAHLLSQFIRDAGMTPLSFDNGEETIAYLSHHSADLLLLDVMLPGIDGFSVLSQIREKSNLPCIMITARISEEDRLKGFSLGVDDYVCKPFSPKEVVARIESVMRRTQGSDKSPAQSNNESTHPDFTINSDMLLATYLGQGLHLTLSEFKILQSLARSPDKIFERDTLLTVLQDFDATCTDRAIDSHIKNLRKKLRKINPSCKLIKSVYGLGYKMTLQEQPKVS